MSKYVLFLLCLLKALLLTSEHDTIDFHACFFIYFCSFIEFLQRNMFVSLNILFNKPKRRNRTFEI